MNKKIFIGILIIIGILSVGAYAVLWPKQEAVPKVYRVGIFSGLAYFDDTIVGFKQKMTELGYVEGKNIIYEVQRGAAPVGNQELLKKFVQEKVDLILVYPTEASIEAKEVTKGTGIPIISTEAFMEKGGLIESIQHPGDNITGVRFPIEELAAKRLEILHELAPQAKRIWIPYLKDYPTVPPALAVIRPIAQSLGLTLVEAPFVSPPELEAYFKALPATGDTGMDAVLFVAEPLSIIPPFVDQIFAFADAHGVPVAGITLSATDSGPIFSLIPDSAKIGQLAAPLADKIFKGTQAGTIPIVTPESELTINVKAIQRLGLTASASLLSTADKIIH